MIVANNQLQIIGNIFLPYSEFTEENADAIANDIAYYTSVMGGNAAFLFGNAKLSEIEGKGLRSKVEYRANKQIRLLDYIELDGGRHKSANDDGVRFRFSETEEEFRATQKEAVEKKGIVMPNLNSAVVEIVDVPQHNFKGNLKEARKEAKKWAKENYIGKKISMPDNGGFYEINGKAIKKYVDETAIENSDNPLIHLSALTKLPEIISNSITGEIHADYKKDENDNRKLENGIDSKDLLVHRLYGAIDISGIVYRVKTTMQEYLSDNMPNKPHSYEVTKIELLEDRSLSGHLNRSNSSIDGTKLLKGVEKSYDKGKFLLSESKNLDNLTTPENAVRELGGKLKLKKAKSSQSYYGEFYEGDFLVGGRKLNLRVSTHPANGYRMGNSDADDKVSIVIYKNGEHYSNGEHAGYVEYTYDEKDVSLNDAANAVLKGVINLIENGEYIDETQKAKFQEYPYVDENGNTRFRVAEEDVEADDYEAIEGGVRFKIVDDEEVIKKFATEPLVKTYRAMVKIGDKYYPPMSTKEDGKLREGNALGDIVQSEERPDLAIEEDGKWYFKLEKDNDDDLEARYNPYLHTSDWMMNDQFKQAGDRPNLVVVEMGLLPSDLESGYHAEKAKDSTGWVAGGWKAGDVANQLPIKRQVALTQYGKMLREVPTQEVAEHIYTFEDWTDSNGVTHEGTNAGTWGGDAYSPRYPSVEYVFDRKVRDAF